MLYNSPMNEYKKKNDTSFTLGTTLTFELLLHKKEKAKRIYVSEKQHHDETYLKLERLAKENHLPFITNKILAKKKIPWSSGNSKSMRRACQKAIISF